MKASLGLEYFGAGQDSKWRVQSALFGGFPSRRPWVAQVTGRSESGQIDREFLAPNTDYAGANSVASRGVTLQFVLETDRLYEVREQVSWEKSIRYFCAVTESGGIYRLSDQEAQEWLNAL